MHSAQATDPAGLPAYYVDDPECDGAPDFKASGFSGFLADLGYIIVVGAIIVCFSPFVLRRKIAASFQKGQ